MFFLYKPKTSKNVPANIQQKMRKIKFSKTIKKTEKFSKTIKKTHHEIVFFFYFIFSFYFVLLFLEIVSSSTLFKLIITFNDNQFYRAEFDVEENCARTEFQDWNIDNKVNDLPAIREPPKGRFAPYENRVSVNNEGTVRKAGKRMRMRGTGCGCGNRCGCGMWEPALRMTTFM